MDLNVAELTQINQERVKIDKEPFTLEQARQLVADQPKGSKLDWLVKSDFDVRGNLISGPGKPTKEAAKPAAPAKGGPAKVDAKTEKVEKPE